MELLSQEYSGGSIASGELGSWLSVFIRGQQEITRVITRFRSYQLQGPSHIITVTAWHLQSSTSCGYILNQTRYSYSRDRYDHFDTISSQFISSNSSFFTN